MTLYSIFKKATLERQKSYQWLTIAGNTGEKLTRKDHGGAFWSDENV